MEFVLWAFLISIAINVVMFVPAYILKTDKLTDLSYALSFVILSGSAYFLSSRQDLHLLLLIMVWLWATRLGVFLFIRIRNIKRDKRFDGMREDFGRFLRFWLLQGASVGTIMIAALMAWGSNAPTATSLSIVGSLVFGLGLLTEHIADSQKYAFNQKNHGKVWIDKGLWRLSRHPNYLGEILVWTGVYLTIFHSLTGTERLVGILSPVYITVLLLFVSGIPLLEKAADKKWGKSNDYKAYKKAVPLLVPTPKSVVRLFSSGRGERT